MSVGTKRVTARAERVAPARRRGWSRYSDRTFYLFIAPWLVLGFIGLGVIPLAYALGLSFTDFDGLSGRWHWIGPANYRELLGDPDMWYSLGRTLLLTVITVPLGIVGGLGLALLLNRRARGIGLLRTIFYVPSIVPVVATALLFRLMFDHDNGLINAVIGRLGAPLISWLVDPTAFAVLVALVLWGLGGGMVIFLAGLQGVPGELREAAAIDGAGGVQTFRHVTLPLLTPVIFFQVIVGVIGSLQRLIEPLLLGGGSAGATVSGTVFQDVQHSNLLYMVYVYQQIFFQNRFGYGAALLWALFAVILLLTLAIFRFGGTLVYYEVDQEKGA